ncbi:secreted protein containing DUF1549 [Rhodopirellula maiorica SM1]|uniref:Secreted protein containing DUF1549 n=1 Tax=Rhodopirellula maiorica SM1 TaxID=1265738 RepID=M5RP79_9BACT|nr:DUF1553 domain-containing protein [Rhodopirellula maiorica]EMI15764.1 secreted protein containing DUF1549 [Rhodopirellula maiorica SM1]
MLPTTKSATRSTYRRLVFLATACSFAIAEFTLPAIADEVEFNRDIRPIFSDTCFKCHGPDANTREAGLRLDERAAAVEDLGGYAAIVPGNADQSEAVARIESDDPELRMPPPDSGLVLTADQRLKVRQWIDQGAKYQRHWAFEPITRPAVPTEFDSHGAIDSFVLKRLEQADLEPLGPASPATQLRRVSLDLTGLPPTIEQSQRFLAEVQANGLDAAYEDAVDRLLQSPRFGERMAWQWLEAARYADTDGYQNDGPREMWRWRDWVIDAYNRNMPFDQFTIVQLAGDLLPNPNEADLIATAFNRNHRYNSEEGIPIDEFLLENAVDRVDTTATIWMGITVACARCHDHKYDPFSQREYYQLIDYFNDVAESGRAIKFGNSEPWIKTPTDAQRSEFEKIQQRVAKCQTRLEAAEADLAAAQQIWETATDFATLPPVVSHGLDHFFDFDSPDKRVVSKGDALLRQEGSITPTARFGNTATVSENNHYELGKIPGLIGNGRFSIAFWMAPGQTDTGVVLSNEQRGTKREGILVEFVDGHLRWNINSRWISGVSTVQTNRVFELGQWKHIVLTNDGTQRAQGMKIYVDGILQPVEVIRNTNSNTANRNNGAAIRIGHSPHVGGWDGQIDELRFYTTRTLSDDEAELLAVADSPQTISAIPTSQRTALQARLLRAAYLEHTDNAAHRRLLSELQTAIAAQTKLWDSLPTTMIMEDLPEGRPSFVRTRGVYDQLGEAVTAGVPAVLTSANQPADRLGFARWLVDEKHPLTARVTVNRYWQMLFGRGLVNTPEDFGSQGDLPTHPELLDWLASEFMDNDWDIKAILKTMVTSDAYRRSSQVTKAHLKHDPDNTLYARAPRKRLPGNVLRDQALDISGLLVERIGGPSVYPYQPAGLWKEASNFTYKVGKGDDLYRRSLYTYWKRTLSPPTMALLDAADREWCSVKPRHTNTPLQSLTLLNDVTFAEAARKFGERILQNGSDDDERIAYAFRRLLCREPTTTETSVLKEALDTYRDEFSQSAEQTNAVLSIGQSESLEKYSAVDRATMTVLANVLLNLEEATTRD